MYLAEGADFHDTLPWAHASGVIFVRSTACAKLVLKELFT